jgi:hypothetical protein
LEFFGVGYAGLENGSADFDNQNAASKHEKTSERLHEAASRLLYPIYNQLEAVRLTQH